MQPLQEIIKEFQEDYYKWGKFDLAKQVPHLIKLADHYQGVYGETKKWQDCLKAHALYNSAIARKPDDELSRKKAFKLQQRFWGATSTYSYEQHRNLTLELQQRLKSIREKYKQAIAYPRGLVSQFNDESIDADTLQGFYAAMKTISLDCSRDMRDFAGMIIDSSIAILKGDSGMPPCDFTAVAIGSLARGEATPYSDLEYLFLIQKEDPTTLDYFVRLSITSYFLIGNLGETKLSYMAIDEIDDWFEDKAKNGFKIDGLSKGAGNIPTGRNSVKNDHFIVSPEKLADRYRRILDNPDEESLRGDLTAMLSYTQEIYSHSSGGQNKLLEKFQKLIQVPIPPQRSMANVKMLQNDLKKFNFIPFFNLFESGFVIDIKKDLYRYPSIVVLDMCLMYGCIHQSSWTSLEGLKGHIARLENITGLSIVDRNMTWSLLKRQKFLLASATYIRLSAYLYYDSHNDRVSVAHQKSVTDLRDLTDNLNNETSVSRIWSIPEALYSQYCTTLVPLKIEAYTDSDGTYGPLDDRMTIVLSLYFSGKYPQAFSKLKVKFPQICHNPLVAVHGQRKVVRFVIADVLLHCGQYRAALTILEQRPLDGIFDNRQAIAVCYYRLEKYRDAIDILIGITEDEQRDRIAFFLGQAYKAMKELEQAECYFIQSYHISNERYGRDKSADLTNALTPEERLNMIKCPSEIVINCLTELGVVYMLQERFILAESYLTKAQDSIVEMYGVNAAVQQAAYCLQSLGLLYIKQEQFGKAVDHYEQALALNRKRADGDGDLDVANILNDLGRAYSSMNQHSKAEKYFMIALARYDTLLPDRDSPKIAKSLYYLGETYKDIRQYYKAEETFSQSLSIYIKILPGRDRLNANVADPHKALGDVFVRRGEYRKAQACYEQALDIHKELSGSVNNRKMARILHNQGITMIQPCKAKKCYSQALEIYNANKLLPSCGLEVADSLFCLGVTCRKMEQYDEAEKTLNEALLSYKELSKGSDSIAIAHTLTELYHLYRSMSETSLIQARDMFLRIDQTNIPKIQSGVCKLGL